MDTTLKNTQAKDDLLPVFSDFPTVMAGGDAGEDGVGGDDTADALRYLVATKARTIEVRKWRGW